MTFNWCVGSMVHSQTADARSARCRKFPNWVITLWENSPADLGGAPTFHPVQLVLPARQSGREPEFCTSIFGWGATSQIDWNLCTSILRWGATSQINWNLFTSLLGWVATSQINWNLCTGLLGWGATSQINWNYVPAYLYGGYHTF